MCVHSAAPETLPGLCSASFLLGESGLLETCSHRLFSVDVMSVDLVPTPHLFLIPQAVPFQERLRIAYTLCVCPNPGPLEEQPVPLIP